MSPGSAVDVPGYQFPAKMLCIHKLEPHKPKTLVFNNLAHPINDTLPLNLAVSSKPAIYHEKDTG